MKRKHIKSEPINIQKLISHLGANKAAISLGITPGAIKKYVRDRSAPYATELAAQSICVSNENGAIIYGDSELINAVKKIMSLGSGKFIDI